MGEASRRRAIGRKATEAMRPASYAPARTVVAYHSDLMAEAAPDEFLGWVAAEISLGSPWEERLAMPLANPLPSAESLLDGVWHLFDPCIGYLGTSETLPSGVVPDPGDPFRHYRLGGTFTVLASLSGTLEIDGIVAKDPGSVLKGTVRLRDDGKVLGPADHPLANQVTRVAEAGRLAGEHGAHIAGLAHLLGKADDMRSREEASDFAKAMHDLASPQGRAMGWRARCEAMVLTGYRHAAIIRGGAVAAWGLAAGIDIGQWTTRDIPGSGHKWEGLDEAHETLTGLRPPLRARWVTLDPGDPAGQAFAGWLREAEVTGMDSGKGITFKAGRGGGIALAAFASQDALHLLGWDVDGRDPPPDLAFDPLATEEVAGLDLSGVLLPVPASTYALDALAIPEAFHGVEGFSNYPAAALVMAHAEGATLGDLAEGIAQRVRASQPVPEARSGIDALFGPAPTPDGRIMAILSSSSEMDHAGPWLRRAIGQLATDFANAGGDWLDLAEEIRGLRSAETQGGTLLDLARQVLARSRDWHPGQA